MREALVMTLIDTLPLSKKLALRSICNITWLMSCSCHRAIMSGAEGWNDIETSWRFPKIDWLRQHRPFANGIPRRLNYGCPHSACIVIQGLKRCCAG